MCTVLNNELKKVTIILITTYRSTILPEPPQNSGGTLIEYCILCKYVIVIMYIGPIHLGLRAIMYFFFFFFYTTMSECMIFYGPIVPEINYSILSYYILSTDLKYHDID